MHPYGCTRGLIGNSLGRGMSLNPEGSEPGGAELSRSSRGNFLASYPEKLSSEAKHFSLSSSFKEFAPRNVQPLR